MRLRPETHPTSSLQQLKAFFFSLHRSISIAKSSVYWNLYRWFVPPLKMPFKVNESNYGLLFSSEFHLFSFVCYFEQNRCLCWFSIKSCRWYRQCVMTYWQDNEIKTLIACHTNCLRFSFCHWFWWHQRRQKKKVSNVGSNEHNSRTTHMKKNMGKLLIT